MVHKTITKCILRAWPFRKAFIYAKCIDYLEAKDYGEEVFKENLDYKIGELSQEMEITLRVSLEQIKTWIEDYDEDD